MSGMTDHAHELHPDSAAQIARRVRALLRTCRKNGLDTKRDLAYELAALKLVLATVDDQAHASGVPLPALTLSEKLAEDLKATFEYLGLGAELGKHAAGTGR